MSSSDPLIREISTLIETRTGLARAAQSPVNLEAAVRELADGDLAGLARRLRDQPETASPWPDLLNALVIGETYFFRNRSHFALLKSHILPDIVARRRGAGRHHLNVWSAGCATGEETYSLAITLRESLPDMDEWRVQLVGTDINPHALGAARRGAYREWAFRQTEPDFRTQYFEPGENGMRLKEYVREIPAFQHRNLLAGAPLPQFDVIFCCNVLLYFEEAAVERGEDILFNALAPGGWLVLGAAEGLRARRDRWSMHLFPGGVLYQKPERKPGIVHHPPPAALRPGGITVTVPGYPEAVIAARAKRYDEAERVLGSLLVREPGHAAAHVLLGCVFAARRALTQAHRQLDEALRIEPLTADAHYLKGLLLLEDGQAEEAKSALRAALYCQRGHPLSAMILGHLLISGGEGGRARRIWAEAREALDGLPLDAPISDLSDLTAEGVASFLDDQLEDVKLV